MPQEKPMQIARVDILVSFPTHENVALRRHLQEEDGEPIWV